MLNHTTIGDHGPRVVFCHGLFGQGKNWTSIAKALADQYCVTLVDMPNHGQSGWTEHLDLALFADQVAELLSADDPVTLVGHSMGGKIAMLLALRHPQLLERLVVVDISPVDYPMGSEFAGYIAGMRALDLETLENRAQADEALIECVPNRTVRNFLLQNLRREADGWRWQPNLALLGDELPVITGWPSEQVRDLPPFTGPVLWIGGDRSAYVRDEYQAAMAAHFPRVRRVTVKGAGHWVHSEKPEIFVEALKRFLAKPLVAPAP